MNQPRRNLLIPMDELKEVTKSYAYQYTKIAEVTKMLAEHCAKVLNERAGIPAFVTPDGEGVAVREGTLERRTVYGENAFGMAQHPEFLMFTWDPQGLPLDFGFVEGLEEKPQ